MAGLEARVFNGASWVAAACRLENTVGTPVDSAEANGSGEAISDLYTLQFSSVVAGDSATVKVRTQSSANPYADSVGVSVDLDGATAYAGIIPGVDLVFSDDGGFTGSWEAEITIGIPMGVRNAFPPDAGVESEEVKVRVYNTGADTGSDCKARLITRVKPYAKTGQVFERVRSFAEAATQKVSGEQVVPYAVVASSVSGSGAAKTMTLEIDGDPFNTLDLTTEDAGDNTGLGVVHYYRITDGPLEGMEFLLSQAAVNSDVANVLVFEQAFAQIAPDVSGAPGDWGTDDVDLTESGEATGDITAGGFATFWLRVLVPAGGNSASNPFIIDVALEGSALNAAGWAD